MEITIQEMKKLEEGSYRIVVCISGGKDSMLMAKLFQELKLHIPIEIFESDIFESVYHVEKSPCYLCARMRRGY